MEANKAFCEPVKYKEILKTILEIPSLACSYQESIAKRLDNKSDIEYMKTE